jgi:glycosyltransferase involved in cell wall biosynthesis
MSKIDIAHLCFSPVFAPGSYNYMADDQVRFIKEYRQVIISFWDKRLNDNIEIPKYYVILNDKNLTLRQRLILLMPQRLKKMFGLKIYDNRWLKYYWGCVIELKRIQPGVIHVYDMWKIGPLLKKEISWPCRLILSEHGLSYYLSREESSIYMLINSYDAIWTLTRTSYRYNFMRSIKYCPLVTVLPHWYNLERYHPVSVQEKMEMRATWNIPMNKNIILLLSRRVPEKGAHLILYSWKKIQDKVKDVMLWIVGSGPELYLNYLKDMINALNIDDSVRIEGYIPDYRKPSCYQSSDLYVFPTLHTEGWAMSLSEAMACGIPCISSNFAVIDDLYNEGELLRVNDPNMEDSFVEPIDHVMNNVSIQSSLAKAGSEAIKNRFTKENAINKIREFYRRQLELTKI